MLGNTLKTKTTVIVTASGAALEWFEFSLYGYLATYLSILFVPNTNTNFGLIIMFGVFASSYLMRPVGGFVLGYLGDKYGRRYAIVLSISLMSLPMFIMTVMPTYNTCGILALIILILARMLQGFSVGGEYTGVLIMLAEISPLKYRGLLTSLAAMASQIGVILGAVVVGVLSTTLNETQMLEYGWRLAFFIGFIFTLISLLFQRSVKESPLFEKEVKKNGKISTITSQNPILITFTGPKMPLIWVFFLTGYVGIAYYMMAVFLPIYFISERCFNVNIIMLITTVTSIIYAVFSPLFGWFTDLWGRKIMLNIPIFLLAILAYPMFFLLNHGGIFQILIIESIFALLMAAMTASYQIAISELFPTNCRYSSMSAAYNIGNALFAGTTPVVSMVMIKYFSSNYAPCYYLIIASLITLIVIYSMPETRRSKYFSDS